MGSTASVPASKAIRALQPSTKSDDVEQSVLVQSAGALLPAVELDDEQLVQLSSSRPTTRHGSTTCFTNFRAPIG